MDALRRFTPTFTLLLFLRTWLHTFLWPGLPACWFAVLLAASPGMAQSPKGYTDLDLHRWELISKRQPRSLVLIYSWSPHMNLSIRGLDEVLAWEKDGGPRVVIILDSTADFELAKGVAQKHHWPNNKVLQVNMSDELIQKGFRVHYPSYMFLEDGRWVSTIIPGDKPLPELLPCERRYVR